VKTIETLQVKIGLKKIKNHESRISRYNEQKRG
jgi:hypothetical protein